MAILLMALAVFAQLVKPHPEDKLNVEIATQDALHAQQPMEPRLAQNALLDMDIHQMELVLHAQMDKLQLEDKMHVPHAHQDARTAPLSMETRHVLLAQINLDLLTESALHV